MDNCTVTFFKIRLFCHYLTPELSVIRANTTIKSTFGPTGGGEHSNVPHNTNPHFSGDRNICPTTFCTMFRTWHWGLDLNIWIHQTAAQTTVVKLYCVLGLYYQRYILFTFPPRRIKLIYTRHEDSASSEDNQSEAPLQLLAKSLPGLITRIQNTAVCQENAIQSEITHNKI